MTPTRCTMTWCSFCATLTTLDDLYIGIVSARTKTLRRSSSRRGMPLILAMLQLFHKSSQKQRWSLLCNRSLCLSNRERERVKVVYALKKRGNNIKLLTARIRLTNDSNARYCSLKILIWNVMLEKRLETIFNVTTSTRSPRIHVRTDSGLSGKIISRIAWERKR